MIIPDNSRLHLHPALLGTSTPRLNSLGHFAEVEYFLQLLSPSFDRAIQAFLL